jgi:outer membrane protein TolC
MVTLKAIVYRLFIITIGVTSGFEVFAQEPLPQPLTLEYALSLASDSSHPNISRLQAGKQIETATLDSIVARNDLSLSLNGRLRWAQPIWPNTDTIVDDHLLSLNLRKSLIDFSGRNDEINSAQLRIKSSEISIEHAYANKRLEIMRRFFDVILADLQFDRDNEQLATVYVSFNRLRDRNELGQISDIDLLEQESLVQNALLKRSQSEGLQRSTRAQLALALNRPNDLPSDLLPPQLQNNWRKLPDYQAIRDQALSSNLELLALAQKLDAANASITAASSSNYPDVVGEVDLAEYTRRIGTADRWRVGVSFTMPLIDDGKHSATISRAYANKAQLLSDHELLQRSIEQQVLNVWIELKQLQLKRKQVEALRNYRELYLDRSRANYEMEFKADLGDAMVQLSEIQLRESQVSFEAALAWEKLRVLTANHIDELIEQNNGSLDKVEN